MKEFIEKLTARLEENKNAELLREEHTDENGMYNDCDEAYEDGQSNGRYQMCVMMLKIVNELAEEHKGGWIPCSERLPEDMQTVLFTSKDGYVDCGLYDADKNWCVNDNYFPNAFRFIAWQPLPEPYKEEEPQWKRAMMNTFLKR